MLKFSTYFQAKCLPRDSSHRVLIPSKSLLDVIKLQCLAVQAVDAPLSPFLQEHVAALAVDNKIILTQTSCGYLEFAVNWISHMEALGITNWLTIAEDETALKFLDARYPGVSPSLCILPSHPYSPSLLLDCEALSRQERPSTEALLKTTLKFSITSKIS